MTAKKSAGDLSAVNWGGEDLQLQTELRYLPSPHITTIMVVQGEVITRVKKPWVPADNQIEEQNRISEFHNRLTSAISRLCDKKWIKLKELPKLSNRLVSIALKFTSGTLTFEALTLLPGARWAALIDDTGDVLEAAPSDDFVSNWGEGSVHLRGLLKHISELFKAGPLEDVSLRLEDSFVLGALKGNEMLIAAIESDTLLEARQMLKRITVNK